MKHFAIIQYEFIKIAKTVANWWQGKKFTHPITHNIVEFKSLPLDMQKRLNAQHQQNSIYDAKFEKINQAGQDVSDALADLLNTTNANDAPTLTKVIDDVQNRMNNDVDVYSKRMREALLNRRSQTHSKDVRSIDNNKDLRKHLEEKKLALKKLDLLIKFYSTVHARRPKIRLWDSKKNNNSSSSGMDIAHSLDKHKDSIQKAMNQWSETVSPEIANPDEYMHLLGYDTF